MNHKRYCIANWKMNNSILESKKFILKWNKMEKINNNVKTIISHRSGESMDNTIADLGVGFGVDYIKTGIYGKVRRSKLKRLMKIEKKLSRKK